MSGYLILLPAAVLLAAGLLAGLFPFKSKKALFGFTAASILAALALHIGIALTPEAETSCTLFTFAGDLPVYFHADTASRLFGILFTFMWLMAAVAAFEYIPHEGAEERYFCFYLLAGSSLSALCYAGNFVTFYVFFEVLSLTSMPLVLHSLTHESIMAALKYLFYSLAGAFLGLFGIFLFASEGNALTFTPGGCLPGNALSSLQLTAIFLMILGFGTKAGMFPMHGWLPTAHPVAPAPASAVLSGVITKAGVLGILRILYFVAGPSLLRGTWVQKAFLALTLITVFMGSMMAYQENILKKRMAYSTVSQVSYVLFGFAALHPLAFAGALMHVVFHSLVKDTLFLSAGAIILKTGKTKVSELYGIGKQMPVTLWCFTLVSITLVGIPPTSAFVSKWYLAVGALASGLPVYSWLGPAILLISALLTAGYLLPISIHGFLPGEEYEDKVLPYCEASPLMTGPMIILTALAVGLGIWAGPLLQVITRISGPLF